MKKNRVLITGAEGQVGSAIKSIAPLYQNLDFVFCSRSALDILDRKDLENVFKNGKFKFCINTAAYTKVDQAEKDIDACMDVNEKGVENLAIFCNKYNCTLIHISSDYVYHPAHNVILNENSPTDPKGIYAKSKLAGEKAIQAELSNYIIIRTSWIYGHSGANFVKTMLALAEKNTSIKVVDDQIGSPTYAKDLAEWCLDMILHIAKDQNYSAYGVFNFSNEGFISWADFARKIFKIKGLKTKVIPIPSSEFNRPALRPLNSRMSKKKISTLLGKLPRTWDSALLEYLEDIS